MDTPSKSFCVLPWMHLATNASGNLRLCCNAKPLLNLIRDPEGKPYSVNSKATLNEMWNSPTYKTVRLQMLKGAWPEACVRCEKEEQSGVKSSRQAWNESYPEAIAPALANTSDDGSAPVNLRYLDLRLGNFCNLKCRMCNPYASRKWLEDWDQVSPALEPKEFQRLNSLDWFLDPKSWDLLSQTLENCDQVYFTGGEPMLIDDHHRFLDFCIQKGVASRITLKYNTNLTVLPKELTELWAPFKKVRLNCSLDALGDLNEYIRYPSRWSTVSKNIQRLEEMGEGNSRLVLTFHMTVQAYNLLHLTEMLDFTLGMKSFRCLPYVNILDRPEHLNIRNLPTDLKHEALARLEAWLERNAGLLEAAEPSYVQKLRSLRGYALAQEQDRASFKQFQDFTRTLDQMRHQKLEQLVPEFGPYL